MTFVDTATNRVKHDYVGRSPHEAFFTQDGSEVWVTVGAKITSPCSMDDLRREDAHQGSERTGHERSSRPMAQYGCLLSFTPETVMVSTQTHEIVGRVKQVSPFCPNIAASPDGEQV